MSADNYYVIRKHPSGGYTAIMAFDSDVDEDGYQILPDALPGHPVFPDMDAAITFAETQWSEYGWYVHPECKRQP